MLSLRFLQFNPRIVKQKLKFVLFVFDNFNFRVQMLYSHTLNEAIVTKLLISLLAASSLLVFCLPKSSYCAFSF